MRRSLPLRAATLAIVALVATAAMVVALVKLEAGARGLSVESRRVGATPVTVYSPAQGAPVPVVVIAHGFAGSRPLMRTFALTLAHNGYLAVTFDFEGHGRNPVPLQGGLDDHARRTDALLAELDRVVGDARRLPGCDGRVALLGHSMASDLVVRYAGMHPEVESTVAVSLFGDNTAPRATRNLLIIDGALEPTMLHDAGYRIVAAAAGGSPAPGTTYGRFADGTAVRIAIAGGVEHIGVLFSRDSMVEALAWVNAGFGRNRNVGVVAPGPWILVLFAAIVALALPASALLPRPRRPAAPALPEMSWRQLLPVAIVPALLTPLLAWMLPGDFTPLLLGDYLLVHFAIYGILTFAAVLLVTRRRVALRMPTQPGAIATMLTAAFAVALLELLAIGSATNAYVANFVPIASRVPMILLLSCGTLAYFLADEWLVRRVAPRRGAYTLGKSMFLLSLAFAIALDPARLFFLAIIIPVAVLLFIMFGLINRWSDRRTRQPFVGAIASAVFFAWAIAVTFPMVAR